MKKNVMCWKFFSKQKFSNVASIKKKYYSKQNFTAKTTTFYTFVKILKHFVIPNVRKHFFLVFTHRSLHFLIVCTALLIYLLLEKRYNSHVGLSNLLIITPYKKNPKVCLVKFGDLAGHLWVLCYQKICLQMCGGGPSCSNHYSSSSLKSNSYK